MNLNCVLCLVFVTSSYGLTVASQLFHKKGVKKPFTPGVAL